MSTEKTIRIWSGCKVVAIVSVSESGSTHRGAVGGAGNSANPDIEIDPWAGLIVDHSSPSSPIAWRDVERDLDAALERGQSEEMS